FPPISNDERACRCVINIAASERLSWQAFACPSLRPSSTTPLVLRLVKAINITIDCLYFLVKRLEKIKKINL
ncbi:MAG: hypothetical protein NUV80_05680, partial [Candidatus Berkelbacteria bacterium]|nr:hypothetical protein [Candidatus Berkelbacteria bacterium]